MFQCNKSRIKLEDKLRASQSYDAYTFIEIEIIGINSNDEHWRSLKI